jgi:outer membrane protein OmpA-like peptidoglycan-associated protein
MLSATRIVLVFVLSLLANGCAQKLTVALVPDPNGSTGSVSVENSAGTVTIDTAYKTTSVADAKSGPANPEVLGKEKLETMFSEALSIQPKQPVHFLIYFKEDTQVTHESLNLIPDILATIKDRKSTSISAIGHTDTSGSKDYNLTLSKQRANAVKALLIKQGINPESIAVTSHGKENPLIATGDNVIEPKNRRVEVVIR